MANEVNQPQLPSTRQLPLVEEKVRKGLRDRYPNLNFNEALEAVKAERSLYEFIKQAWNVVHPEPFTPGRHIEMVARHLQAVTEGKIKKLLIAIPPRHSKSSLVSVFWTAWEWIHDPGKSYMCVSHKQDLTLRDAKLCRELMESAWYRQRWGNKWRFKRNQNAEGRYANDKGGWRLSTTRQGVMGEGADRTIIDDIISAEKVEKSKTELEAANTWYSTSIALRKNNPNVATVVMMQRLHENDLIGYLLRTEPDEWVQLFLPMLFVPERKCVTEFGEDWRTEEGEFLWPEYANLPDKQGKVKGWKAIVDEYANILDEYGFSCQCQQWPVPASGGIFKADWWQTAFSIPKNEMPYFFTSWDLATKTNSQNDFTAGIVFCYIPRTTQYYILEIIEKRVEFTDAEELIIETARKYPQCAAHVIEEYQTGAAIISRLQKAKEEGKITGAIETMRLPQDKPSKFRAAAPIVKAGRVFVLFQAPHKEKFLKQMGMLPKALHDDMGDAFSQAIIWRESQPPEPMLQIWNPNTDEEVIKSKNAANVIGGNSKPWESNSKGLPKYF